MTENKEVKLSNGITVFVGPIDATIYLEIVSQLENKAPKPPQVYVKSIKTYQPNYDHPDYQRDVERYQMVTTQRMLEFFLMDGVKKVVCPKSIPDHNSKDFEKRLSLLRMDVPEDEDERRLMWLKLIAFKNQEDLSMVTQEVARMSGVSEKDVQTAEAAFPSEDKQQTNQGT